MNNEDNGQPPPTDSQDSDKCPILVLLLFLSALGASVMSFARWAMSDYWKCVTEEEEDHALNIIGSIEIAFITVLWLPTFFLLSKHLNGRFYNYLIGFSKSLGKTPGLQRLKFTSINVDVQDGEDASLLPSSVVPDQSLTAGEKKVLVAFMCNVVFWFVALLFFHDHRERRISENLLGSNYMFIFTINMLGYTLHICLLHLLARSIKGAKMVDSTPTFIWWVFSFTVVKLAFQAATHLTTMLKCASQLDDGSDTMAPDTVLLLVMTTLFEWVLNFLMLDLIFMGCTYKSTGDRFILPKRMFEFMIHLIQDMLGDCDSECFSLLNPVFLTIAHFVIQIGIFVPKMTYAEKGVTLVDNGHKFDVIMTVVQCLISVAFILLLLASYKFKSRKDPDHKEEWVTDHTSFFFANRNGFRSLMLLGSFFVYLFCLGYRCAYDKDVTVTMFQKFFLYAFIFLAFPSECIASNAMVPVLHATMSILIMITDVYRLEVQSSFTIPYFFSQVFESVLCLQLFSILAWREEWL